MDESKDTTQAEVHTLTIELPADVYQQFRRHYVRYHELPDVPRLTEAEFAASALRDVLGLLDVLDEQRRRVVGPGEVITVPKLVPPRELRRVQ